MPVRISKRPLCGYCDGFPVVAITTGTRHRDGSRVIFRVVCPRCDGTGHALPVPVLRPGLEVSA
ncbi:hypothetical protein [Streptomyces sp. NBC_00588]|uniref:hypothetical protein n=1 Tax=Streptomyces sp. NBC_00588 TaxID=2975784 RepID=UPI002E81C45B|nr:hypothetical protein [Streptomyces sp. NBC_00588]WUB37263.1 hypothetical protein OHN38_21070 [Streptomyces sp. NBC_00588]